MATPTRTEIETYAKELWHRDRARSGDPGFDVEPELNELREGGYLSSARSELMTSIETKNAQWFSQHKNFEEIETSTDSTVLFDVQEALNTGFALTGAKQCGKTTMAKHFVRELLGLGVIVYVLDVSQAWNHDSPITKITQITKHNEEYEWKGSQILDMSSLGIRERVLFVNELCREIYDSHVYGDSERTFLVFEEAHTYLPNGCMRMSVRKKNVLDGVLDLITVGANYKIGFGLITQFPAMVDKTPIKACLQRYFGWTWEKNDVNYIKGFLPKEWSEKLRDLQRGQFIRQCRNDIRIVENEKPFNEAKHETVYSFKTRVICA